MCLTARLTGAMVIALAVVLESCAPSAEDVVSSRETPTIAAVPSGSAFLASAPVATTPNVPFPDLPLVAGTRDGDLYFRIVGGRPEGRKVHVCDGSVLDLIAYERQVAAFCGPDPMRAGWYLWNGTSVSLIARPALGVAAFTGANGFAYTEAGHESPPAPIPTTRLMLRDLVTGQTTQIDERFGVAEELRLTDEGVAVWRPRVMPSFVRLDAEAGTWLLRNAALTRYSTLRLIESRGGRALLESEATESMPDCCHSVFLRDTTEQRLTPGDIQDERALALLDDGTVLAWRPTSTTEGDVVAYRNAAISRVRHGQLSSSHVLRIGDWLVAHRNVVPALVAYRISDGAFAAAERGDFTALAALASR